jgi:hypothetical protein
MILVLAASTTHQPLYHPSYIYAIYMHHTHHMVVPYAAGVHAYRERGLMTAFALKKQLAVVQTVPKRGQNWLGGRGLMVATVIAAIARGIGIGIGVSCL